jgi:hypothetical protein
MRGCFLVSGNNCPGLKIRLWQVYYAIHTYSGTFQPSSPVSMKTRLLLLYVCLMTSISAYSQTDAKNSAFSIVPQAGFNVSRLTTEDTGGRVGAQFGVSARFGQRFYVQPGFYWLRQVPNLYQEPDQLNESALEDDVAINGFRLQALAGYKLVNTSVFNLRAQAGPAVSWVSRVRDNEFGLVRNDFNSTIWGAKVGGGIDVFFLTLDINYEIGLSQVFRTYSDARNNVLSVTLGARLDF